MSIEEYFKDWIKVIDKDKLNLIVSKLRVMRNTTPPLSLAFKAFQLCNYNDLKIVMIGQDPYPQKDVATGILFGNDKKVSEENLSPSLKIIKEAVIDFEVPHNCIIFDQTLESWAKQGILMLNSALTVEVNNIGSHSILWRPFIAKLLENLSLHNTAIIYVLFGRQAQSFKPYINSRLNHILEIEHPAYFARNGTKMPSKLFNDINRIVKGIYNEQIKWYEEY